jgi:hypothetical protein
VRNDHEEEVMRSSLCLVATAAALLGGAAAARAQGGFTEEQVLARFKHEPSVQAVQDAAIRYYQVHPDRIKSLRSNAQLKALVPVISTGFANAIGSQKRVMSDGLYLHLESGWKENEAVNLDSMAFQVGATWNLDRLVFNAEVLDVQSLIGILDGVVREVTTIYYIRRRLQIDNLLRPPTDLASKISSTIRIEELTGLLDAMTGAFMSKSLKAAKRGEQPPPTAKAPQSGEGRSGATMAGEGRGGATKSVPTAAMPAAAAAPTGTPAALRVPGRSDTLMAPR